MKQAIAVNLKMKSPPRPQRLVDTNTVTRRPRSNPHGPIKTLDSYDARSILPPPDNVLRRIVKIQASSLCSNTVQYESELQALFKITRAHNYWIYIMGLKNHFGLTQVGLTNLIQEVFRRPHKRIPPTQTVDAFQPC